MHLHIVTMIQQHFYFNPLHIAEFALWVFELNHERLTAGKPEYSVRPPDGPSYVELQALDSELFQRALAGLVFDYCFASSLLLRLWRTRPSTLGRNLGLCGNRARHTIAPVDGPTLRDCHGRDYGHTRRRQYRSQPRRRAPALPRHARSRYDASQDWCRRP